MNQSVNEKYFKILLSSRVTEKSTALAVDRQYVFQVKSDSNKRDIKEAVEKMFNVEVVSVRICNVCGKIKRFGQAIGKRKSFKKAFITLKEGQVINFK